MGVNKKSWKDLSEDIAKNLTKKWKKSTFEISKGIADYHASAVTDWIPTGCNILDLAISNKVGGGYPCGRMTVLYGPEQSGKSLSAMHALAETQKLDGVAFYVDVERSFHQGFAEAIGVDVNELWLTDSNKVEDLFPMLIDFILSVREHDSKRKITIVIDSLAGLLTIDDDDDEWGVKGYNTKKSVIFADGFKKLIPIIDEYNVCLIATNQARVKMGATKYESPWRSPGGQAVPHYASVIILMTKSSTKKAMVNGMQRVIGRTTRAKIEKNRLGPPEVIVMFDVYFDRGIDNFGNWFDYAKTFKVCKFSGAWVEYEFVDKKTGDIVTYKENGWDTFIKNVLIKNKEVADEIWGKISEKFLMTYKVKSDEVEVIDEKVK